MKTGTVQLIAEINDLEMENEELRNCIDINGSPLQEENKRLKEAFEETKSLWLAANKSTAKAREENKRLREALDAVRRNQAIAMRGHMELSIVYDIADKALNGKEGE